MKFSTMDLEDQWILRSSSALTFNYGHGTCYLTKNLKRRNWRIGGSFLPLESVYTKFKIKVYKHSRLN